MSQQEQAMLTIEYQGGKTTCSFFVVPGSSYLQVFQALSPWSPDPTDNTAFCCDSDGNQVAAIRSVSYDGDNPLGER